MPRNSKRIKNVPVDWDELKQNRTINLTDTAWKLLGEKAKSENISRSEVIERTVRRLLNW